MIVQRYYVEKWENRRHSETHKRSKWSDTVEINRTGCKAFVFNGNQYNGNRTVVQWAGPWLLGVSIHNSGVSAALFGRE